MRDDVRIRMMDRDSVGIIYQWVIPRDKIIITWTIQYDTENIFRNRITRDGIVFTLQ